MMIKGIFYLQVAKNCLNFPCSFYNSRYIFNKLVMNRVIAQAGVAMCILGIYTPSEGFLLEVIKSIVFFITVCEAFKNVLIAYWQGTIRMLIMVKE